MRPPLIIGHRGAPESAVENTEEAFRAALEAGAQLLETDVRVTADGHVLVAHDPDFSRLGGPAKPILRCNRSEIEGLSPMDGEGRRWKPLFMDRALEIFPDVRFSVDLKDPGSVSVAPWVDLMRRTSSFSRCRTASFSDRTLRLLRKEAPEAPVSVARMGVAALLVGASLGRPRKPDAAEGVLHLPERAGTLRVITPRHLDAWHSSGWKIHAWTVDNEEDMRRLIEWGVDGIITNRPSLLKRTVESLSAEEPSFGFA